MQPACTIGSPGREPSPLPRHSQHFVGQGGVGEGGTPEAHRSASFGHAERGKTRNTPKAQQQGAARAGDRSLHTQPPAKESIRRTISYDGTQSYASVSSSNTGQHFCFWKHCACPSTRLARVPREAGFRSGHEKGLNSRAGRRQQRETRRGLSRPPGFLHVLGALANCLPSPGSC